MQPPAARPTSYHILSLPVTGADRRLVNVTALVDPACHRCAHPVSYLLNIMAFPSFTGACSSILLASKELSTQQSSLLAFPVSLIVLLLFRKSLLRLSKAMVSRMGSSQPSGEPFNGDEKPLVRPEGPSREFSGNIKVSQKLPTKKDIEKVAELPVLDRTGESRTFKSLHSDPEHPEARTLVIFIRHFFCGVRSCSLPPTTCIRS